MAADVICPDCGKYIAAPGEVEETVRCKCALDAGASFTFPQRRMQVDDEDDATVPAAAPAGVATAPTHIPANGDGDARDEEAAGGPDASAPAPKPAKLCFVCGTDLTGHPRLKDHLARYWCATCAEADKRAKQRAAANTCADCSRVFPPSKLFEYDVVKVCKNCYKARIKEAETKLRKMGNEVRHKKAELQRITWMAIVVVVLIVIATLNMLFG